MALVTMLQGEAHIKKKAMVSLLFLLTSATLRDRDYRSFKIRFDEMK